MLWETTLEQKLSFKEILCSMKMVGYFVHKMILLMSQPCDPVQSEAGITLMVCVVLICQFSFLMRSPANLVITFCFAEFYCQLPE